MDNRLKKTTGFTLIELISTIVLVGIIGVFTSFFIYSAVNSFIYTKAANEGALKAQIALDRISLELRGINGISDYSDDTRNPDNTVYIFELQGFADLVYGFGNREEVIYPSI